MNTSRYKFRVWDKRKKRYDERYTIGTDGLAYQLSDVGDYWYDLIPNEEVTIEQCTGLKDKNDKLIYEGDVFEATVLNSFDGDSMVGKRIRGQVAYFTDSACFTFAAYAPFNLGQIEIIGNIHYDQFREVTNLTEN